MLFGRHRSISQMTTNPRSESKPLPVKLGRTTLPPVAVHTQSGLSHQTKMTAMTMKARNDHH
jgi:hypothetical protein